MDEKYFKEIFESLNKNNNTNKKEEFDGDHSWIMLFIILILFWGFPSYNNSKDYLQGKVDVYEKIIGRLL